MLLAQNLTRYIQEQISIMQNPKDCKNARILVCANKYYQNKAPEPICGWGCLVIQLLRCVKMALTDNRMLVADMSFYR